MNKFSMKHWIMPRPILASPISTNFHWTTGTKVVRTQTRVELHQEKHSLLARAPICTAASLPFCFHPSWQCHCYYHPTEETQIAIRFTYHLKLSKRTGNKQNPQSRTPAGTESIQKKFSSECSKQAVKTYASTTLEMRRTQGGSDISSGPLKFGTRTQMSCRLKLPSPQDAPKNTTFASFQNNNLRRRNQEIARPLHKCLATRKKWALIWSKTKTNPGAARRRVAAPRPQAFRPLRRAPRPGRSPATAAAAAANPPHHPLDRAAPAHTRARTARKEPNLEETGQQQTSMRSR